MATLKKSSENLTFAIIAKAMDCSSLGSGWAGESIRDFLADRSLTEVPQVWAATHSFGGRDWAIVEGREPAFCVDDWGPGSGWYVFIEEDVTFLRASSATSGSCLTAEKATDGSWRLSLEVPVEDGVPYQGWYWKKYHAALDGKVWEPRPQTAPVM